MKQSKRNIINEKIKSERYKAKNLLCPNMLQKLGNNMLIKKILKNLEVIGYAIVCWLFFSSIVFLLLHFAR